MIISLADPRSTPSIDQFDSGRFLAARESIAGHRLDLLSTLDAKKEMDGNGRVIAEMMPCSTSWCPAPPFSGCIVIHVAFFHPKEMQR